MLSRLILLLWAALPLAVVTAPQAAQAAPPQATPQAASGSTDEARDAHRQASDRAAASAAQAEQTLARARAEQARLKQQYQRQLSEIDTLKRGRASWRRDRLLKGSLRASNDTAAALRQAEARVRSLEGQLDERRKRWLSAVERELAAAPSPQRARSLARHREVLLGHLRPDAKKIVLPDERIDPLADPEDLEHQAALLRESEAELAKELGRLERRVSRYRHMAALSLQRTRADQLGRLDDDQPRRRASGRRNSAPPLTDDVAGGGDDSDGRGGAPPPPSPSEPGGGTGGPESPSETPDGGDEGGVPPDDVDMFDIILADVVDSPTIDALRAAERSNNPAFKASAVERASEQVRSRLERLRARRLEIQQRARDLRR
ncbi:MAG: hypothetical protein Tsb0020_28340 [Haliangiales bacterium]